MTMQEADAKCSELFQLMKPHVSTNVMQRVNMYVVNATEKKLPEFIATAEAELKGRIIGELIEIVKAGDWDKLPVVPNGQASGKAAAPVVAPRPVVVPTGPAALGAQLPTPAPVPPKPKLIEVPAPVVTIAPEPVKSVTVIEEEKPEPEADETDPLAIITAQLAKLTKPVKPGMTQKDERRVVRHELAVILKSLSEVLSKAQ